MATVKSLYRQIRERAPHYTARDAIFAVRCHIAGPLAKYQAAMSAWQAEPDKRRYAPGGSANRPKYPQLFPAQRESVHALREATKPRNIKSWYADTMQDALYCPAVWLLPHGRFVAGYTCDEYGTETVARESWDNERDAWRVAERMAQRDAKDSRDYSTAWDAGRLYGDNCDAIAKARKEMREVAAAARDNVKNNETICNVLRGKVRELRAGVREMLRDNRALRDGEYSRGDNWLGFSLRDPALVAAFNDGAGRQVIA